MMATIGAATAGTIVGMTALLLAQKSEKDKQKDARLQRLKDRKRRYLEQKLFNDLVADSEQPKAQKRRVNLYFDENDEMIERDEEDDEEEDNAPLDRQSSK